MTTPTAREALHREAARERARRRSRRRRRLLRLAGALGCLVLLVVMAAHFATREPFLRQTVLPRILGTGYDRSLQIGGLKATVFPPSIHAYNLQLIDLRPGPNEPRVVASIGKVVVRAHWLPPQRVTFQTVELQGAELELVRNAAGELNFTRAFSDMRRRIPPPPVRLRGVEEGNGEGGTDWISRLRETFASRRYLGQWTAGNWRIRYRDLRDARRPYEFTYDVPIVYVPRADPRHPMDLANGLPLRVEGYFRGRGAGSLGVARPVAIDLTLTNLLEGSTPGADMRIHLKPSLAELGEHELDAHGPYALGEGIPVWPESVAGAADIAVFGASVAQLNRNIDELANIEAALGLKPVEAERGGEGVAPSAPAGVDRAALPTAAPGTAGMAGDPPPGSGARGSAASDRVLVRGLSISQRPVLRVEGGQTSLRRGSGSGRFVLTGRPSEIASAIRMLEFPEFQGAREAIRPVVRWLDSLQQDEHTSSSLLGVHVDGRFTPPPRATGLVEAALRATSESTATLALRLIGGEGLFAKPPEGRLDAKVELEYGPFTFAVGNGPAVWAMLRGRVNVTVSFPDRKLTLRDFQGVCVAAADPRSRTMAGSLAGEGRQVAGAAELPWIRRPRESPAARPAASGARNETTPTLSLAAALRFGGQTDPAAIQRIENLSQLLLSGEEPLATISIEGDALPLDPREWMATWRKLRAAEGLEAEQRRDDLPTTATASMRLDREWRRAGQQWARRAAEIDRLVTAAGRPNTRVVLDVHPDLLDPVLSGLGVLAGDEKPLLALHTEIALAQGDANVRIDAALEGQLSRAPAAPSEAQANAPAAAAASPGAAPTDPLAVKMRVSMLMRDEELALERTSLDLRAKGQASLVEIEEARWRFSKHRGVLIMKGTELDVETLLRVAGATIPQWRDRLDRVRPLFASSGFVAVGKGVAADTDATLSIDYDKVITVNTALRSRGILSPRAVSLGVETPQRYEFESRSQVRVNPASGLVEIQSAPLEIKEIGRLDPSLTIRMEPARQTLLLRESEALESARLLADSLISLGRSELPVPLAASAFAKEANSWLSMLAAANVRGAAAPTLRIEWSPIDTARFQGLTESLGFAEVRGRGALTVKLRLPEDGPDAGGGRAALHWSAEGRIDPLRIAGVGASRNATISASGRVDSANLVVESARVRAGQTEATLQATLALPSLRSGRAEGHLLAVRPWAANAMAKVLAPPLALGFKLEQSTPVSLVREFVEWRPVSQDVSWQLHWSRSGAGYQVSTKLDRVESLEVGADRRSAAMRTRASIDFEAGRPGGWDTLRVGEFASTAALVATRGQGTGSLSVGRADLPTTTTFFEARILAPLFARRPAGGGAAWLDDAGAPAALPMDARLRVNLLRAATGAEAPVLRGVPMTGGDLELRGEAPLDPGVAFGTLYRFSGMLRGLRSADSPGESDWEVSGELATRAEGGVEVVNVELQRGEGRWTTVGTMDAARGRADLSVAAIGNSQDLLPVLPVGFRLLGSAEGALIDFTRRISRETTSAETETTAVMRGAALTLEGIEQAGSTPARGFIGTPREPLHAPLELRLRSAVSSDFTTSQVLLRRLEVEVAELAEDRKSGQPDAAAAGRLRPLATIGLRAPLRYSFAQSTLEWADRMTTAPVAVEARVFPMKLSTYRRALRALSPVSPHDGTLTAVLSLRPAPGDSRENPGMRLLVSAAARQVRFSSSGKARAAGAGADVREEIPSLDFDLDSSVRWQRGVATLEKGELAMVRPGVSTDAAAAPETPTRFVDRIALAGQLGTARLGLEPDLQVTSSFFDARPYAPLVAAFLDVDREEQLASGREAGGAGGAETLRPVVIPRRIEQVARQLPDAGRVRMSFRELQIAEARLRDVTGVLRWRGGRVELADAGARAGEGRIAAEAALDLREADGREIPARFTVFARSLHLPVTEWFGLISSPLRSRIAGTVTGELRFSGRGLTAPELAQSLAGEGTFRIEGGRIGFVDRNWDAEAMEGFSAELQGRIARNRLEFSMTTPEDEPRRAIELRGAVADVFGRRDLDARLRARVITRVGPRPPAETGKLEPDPQTLYGATWRLTGSLRGPGALRSQLETYEY